MRALQQQERSRYSYETHIQEYSARFHDVQTELATPYVVLKHSTILTDILQLQVTRFVPWIITREL